MPWPSLPKNADPPSSSEKNKISGCVTVERNFRRLKTIAYREVLHRNGQEMESKSA